AWATAAVAIAFVLVQATIDAGRPGGDFEIAGEEGGVGMMPFAFVTFKPEASIAQIAAFLSENGAVISGGPTAGGVFRIALPARTASDYERLTGLVAAQPFVEKVSEGRKPANGG
ncbi:MAG: anti-sigma factor, partial [Pseudaminobacter sp.]|nr:anti-sigma factor [Pseudaminobacter sp.]